jgi:hypothetical protein
MSSASYCPLLAVPPREASDERGFRVQSTLKSRFEPELSLFIQLTGASYGAKLQDLRYTYTRSSESDGRRILCTYLLSIHGTLSIDFEFDCSLLKRLRLRCLGRFFLYMEP